MLRTLQLLRLGQLYRQHPPLLNPCQLLSKWQIKVPFHRYMSSNSENDADKNIGSKAKSRNSAKEYISENPEINRILSDLYDKYDEDPEDDKKDSSTVYSQFNDYKEENSKIIYDVDEERELKELLELEAEENLKLQDEMKKQIFQGLNLNRGVRGVFEIEDLVEVLRREKCADICVIRVPPEKSYVDYFVIGTCRNARHLRASAEFVYRVIKQKSLRPQDIPDVEGRKTSKSWIAMDMGNIALHLFTQEARDYYDLESLWCLGAELDEKANEHLFRDFIQEHDMLKDLQPLS